MFILEGRITKVHMIAAHSKITILIRVALLLVLSSFLFETPIPGNAFDSPQQGLTIVGHVNLNDGGDPLPDTQIYRGYATYGGGLVATTDQTGYYDSGFSYIPGDEMVTVWAEKAGYSLDPQQYYWRHYYGDEWRHLDFIARPLITDCPPPLPVPHRLCARLAGMESDGLTTSLYLWLGVDSNPWTVPATVTVTSEAGTVITDTTLVVLQSTAITIPLLMDTVHHITVYGQFEHTTGCHYTTRTNYDFLGNRLNLLVGNLPVMMYLPLITR